MQCLCVHMPICGLCKKSESDALHLSYRHLWRTLDGYVGTGILALPLTIVKHVLFTTELYV